MPHGMKRYLKNFGYHFNGLAYRFAVSQMYKEGKDGREETMDPVEKDKVFELLKKYNISIENDMMFDSAYVYSMAMADFFGRSLPTEQSVALFIKDKIDDPDQPRGYLFNEWYAKMVYAGIPIDWDDLV